MNDPLDPLVLFEPCPICLRLTASRAARRVDVDPWGVGTHRHCLTAAARWYPEAFGRPRPHAEQADTAAVVPLVREAVQ